MPVSSVFRIPVYPAFRVIWIKVSAHFEEPLTIIIFGVLRLLLHPFTNPMFSGEVALGTPIDYLQGSTAAASHTYTLHISGGVRNIVSFVVVQFIVTRQLLL